MEKFYLKINNAEKYARFVMKEYKNFVVRVKYACGHEEEIRSDYSYRKAVEILEKAYASEMVCVLRNGVSVKRRYHLDPRVTVIAGWWGRTICFTVVSPHRCDDCYYSLRYKEEYKPDESLQRATYCHGVATGFGHGDTSPEGAIKRIKKILKIGAVGEICCSERTQQVGGCGIYLKGRVTVASNFDLWSELNALGERVFGKGIDKGRDAGIFTSSKEQDLTLWTHTEFFVVPKKIEGFWVKRWYVQKYPEFLPALKRLAYKMPVVVIDDDDD